MHPDTDHNMDHHLVRKYPYHYEMRFGLIRLLASSKSHRDILEGLILYGIQSHTQGVRERDQNTFVEKLLFDCDWNKLTIIKPATIYGCLHDSYFSLIQLLMLPLRRVELVSNIILQVVMFGKMNIGRWYYP